MVRVGGALVLFARRAAAFILFSLHFVVQAHINKPGRKIDAVMDAPEPIPPNTHICKSSTSQRAHRLTGRLVLLSSFFYRPNALIWIVLPACESQGLRPTLLPAFGHLAQPLALLGCPGGRWWLDGMAPSLLPIWASGWPRFWFMMCPPDPKMPWAGRASSSSAD